MANINHYCVICGKGYHSCDSCSDIKKFRPWQKIADTSNHYKIYQILNDYVYEVISIAKAQELLKKCDISDYKTFKPNIVKTIDKIISFKEQKTQPKKVKKETVVSKK